jgi:DNA-binding CsgD family transcriptional regulator/tetratricopeptide (TPR) repeat protein
MRIAPPSSKPPAPVWAGAQDGRARQPRPKPGKTLDFLALAAIIRVVGAVRPLRQAVRTEDVRARAEDKARAGSPAAALALMTAAAEDVEAGDPHAAALLLAEASWYARLAHGPARALQVARRATRLASGADGRVALIVHGRLGDALQWNGRYAEAKRHWLKAAAATTSPEPHLLLARTDALLRGGELVAARESAYASAARARETRDGDSLRDALTFQAMAEVHLGLLREADASASELETAVGHASSSDRVDALGLHAWIEAMLHEEATCRARIAAAMACAAELGITPSQGMAAGLLALRGGQYEEAVAHLETKLVGGSPLAAALSLRPFLDGLVEACARSGRDHRARELVEEVFKPALATEQPRYVAVAFRMRGLTTGELRNFELALQQHAGWGNRFEEGRTRLLYGEALRRTKRRNEARDQLSAATSAFAAVGASAWARRARDELRAAGARLPREASGGALTTQEERIARLVAEGLSNKEIAARLVVSTKTVEGHLRNIFEKLGVTSRTQVARTVLR